MFIPALCGRNFFSQVQRNFLELRFLLSQILSKFRGHLSGASVEVSCAIEEEQPGGADQERLGSLDVKTRLEWEVLVQ